MLKEVKRGFDVIMQKDMKKQRSSNCGHTLGEIIIGIVILGIIATFALPRYTVSIEKMKSAEGIQILEALLTAQRQYKYEHGQYCADGGTPCSNFYDVQIPTSEHFTWVSYSTATSYLAQVTRTNAAYDLYIYADGHTDCRDGSVIANICQKMGFAQHIE